MKIHLKLLWCLRVIIFTWYESSRLTAFICRQTCMSYSLVTHYSRAVRSAGPGQNGTLYVVFKQQEFFFFTSWGHQAFSFQTSIQSSIYLKNHSKYKIQKIVNYSFIWSILLFSKKRYRTEGKKFWFFVCVYVCVASFGQWLFSKTKDISKLIAVISL